MSENQAAATARPSRPAKVVFVYDIASPTSWIALITMLRYQEPWNLDLELQPILVGSAMRATGVKKPHLPPVKQQYYDRDLRRVAERWGVTINPPPEDPFDRITRPAIRFLRTLKAHEPSDVLVKATLLLFEEYFTVGTPVTSPKFFDCLSSSHGKRGPLSESRLQQLLAFSQQREAEEGLDADVRYVVEKWGTWGVPWMVAHRVPPDDRNLSDEEKILDPLPPTEWQSFHTENRIEALGYYLGPEYIWRGPWPDGIERFSASVGPSPAFLIPKRAPETGDTKGKL
ncbi:uncharacterized protein EI90DRAFT_3287086 [Cantharellus anzutake]|uniref:uncharacterized protein n=1 Tax=Cantharellus anzutake TaxID=1750568 RepID=UPI001905EC59|nr:uncharacterized protein EI90DRAFT_3287086 [Cantharellus anzutake]KAF8337485.1 hypothetical protein EI90DRAFT_3287086 [Cantharellus anzutake]